MSEDRDTDQTSHPTASPEIPEITDNFPASPCMSPRALDQALSADVPFAEAAAVAEAQVRAMLAAYPPGQEWHTTGLVQRIYPIVDVVGIGAAFARRRLIELVVKLARGPLSDVARKNPKPMPFRLYGREVTGWLWRTGPNSGPAPKLTDKQRIEELEKTVDKLQRLVLAYAGNQSEE